jgi:hypothetical protein
LRGISPRAADLDQWLALLRRKHQTIAGYDVDGT